MPATRPSTPATTSQAPAAAQKEAVSHKAVEAPIAAPATDSKSKPVHDDIAPPPTAVIARAIATADTAGIIAKPSASMPPRVAAVSTAAVPSQVPPKAASSWPAPAFRKRSPLLPALLWVITAAIPAIVVWAVMRTPTPPQSVELVRPKLESRVAPTPSPPPQEPIAKPMPVESPPQVAPTPVEPAVPAAQAAATATEPSAAPTQSAAAAVSSASPAPSASVVVETDSTDRVSILVKSRPTGAKVYRRGKEIGRTPLTIQIGRSEHRIFEVGWASSGSKRISLDGEKSEITVNLGGDPKASQPEAPH